MTSGASPSIIGRAAANIRNAERVSTDNGNVESRSDDKAACLRLLPCALRSMDLGRASGWIVAALLSAASCRRFVVWCRVSVKKYRVPMLRAIGCAIATAQPETARISARRLAGLPPRWSRRSVVSSQWSPTVAARPPGVFSISDHRETASFRSLIGPQPVRPNPAANIAIQRSATRAQTRMDIPCR
jgi:hypothetical protein